MSRSIIIKKPGGPDVLELTDTKVGSPGPNEIKITNLAIGLNYIDTYHRSGLYSLPMPSGIGLEAAGKIDEVGANVKEFNIPGLNDNIFISISGSEAFPFNNNYSCSTLTSILICCS